MTVSWLVMITSWLVMIQSWLGLYIDFITEFEAPTTHKLGIGVKDMINVFHMPDWSDIQLIGDHFGLVMTGSWLVMIWSWLQVFHLFSHELLCML